MWLALLPLTALAAGGFYHPADVAAASKLYAKAADQAGGAFEDHQRGAESLSRALLDYELALDLLGDRAPAAERQRLDALTKEFNRERAVLEAFANTMMEDFDAEFSAAMERALAKHAGAKECERTIADGPAVPGIGGRSKPNPACTGEDLNEKIAAAMDADAKLQKSIGEILSLKWPEVALDAAPQAPIGGDARWISVDAFFRGAAKDALKKIDREDAEAREKFEAAIEEGADKDKLAGLVAEADKVTAETAKKRAALGAPVLSAADATLGKWAKKEGATGWCAQPALLGGCTGTDATKELSERLKADKKVAGALP
jgi:hypothetical protein